jgi:protein transport protein SEC24
VRDVVEQVRARRQRFLKLIVVKQKDKTEGFFRKFLVEDKGVDGSPSYVDYLCHLHRQIKDVLS